MKKQLLFKILIDILFFIQIPIVLGMIILLPSGITLNSDETLLTKHWNYEHWLVLLFNFAAYTIFLKGLFHLRKVARILLSNNYFTTKVIYHIKKCGTSFTLVGISYLLLTLIATISKLFTGKLSISLDSISFSALFLIIIGLFFIIQSNVLAEAKSYKEENELIV